MRCWLSLAPLLVASPAFSADLRVLVDTGTEMPMARFVQGELVEGIHKDIGVALAQGTGRRARFIALPRKRIAKALEDGSGDVICSYMPEWLPGNFYWSLAFIPIGEMLVSDRSAVRPQKLEDVAGQRIGTVLGYSHPELEEALGTGFVRDDAPSAEANLRKLAAGRVKYAVTGKAYLEYRLKQGDLPLSLHPPLLVKNYIGHCAVSRKGTVSLAEVNGAILQIVKDGVMDKIMRRYQ